MGYILLLINIVLLVLGQILWKFGAKTLRLSFSFSNLIQILKSPYIIGGCILYLIATSLWIILLAKYPLSKIYPLQSLCYILGAIVGIVIFKEGFYINRIIGIGLIMLGAGFVTIK